MKVRNRGSGIRRIRGRKDLSQEQLAELTDAGPGPARDVRTVRRHERGETDGDETHQVLCEALREAHFPEMESDVFHQRVNYEAGLACIVTDAIQACEAEGVPIVDRILGTDSNHRDESTDDGSSATATKGIPPRVAKCAEVLEKRIESSIGNTESNRRALAKALAPDLLRFNEQPIHGQKGLRSEQADALAGLVAALGVGFIEPCSLDMSKPLLQVRGVESGWLMHLVFNTQRGHPVTLQLDWETSPPSLLRPDCSFQIPPPDDARNRKSSDRKTLIRANRIAPGYTMGNEWEEESISTLDRLNYDDAFFGINQALLAREDAVHAPFADAPKENQYRPYIKHLHATKRLPDLKVIKAGSTRANLVLKRDVEEKHVHSFFQNCLQAINEARLANEMDRWLEHKDVDKLITTLLTQWPVRQELPQFEEALTELKGLEEMSDKKSGLQDFLIKWGSRASQAGSHGRNLETVGGWIMKLLEIGPL